LVPKLRRRFAIVIGKSEQRMCRNYVWRRNGYAATIPPFHPLAEPLDPSLSQILVQLTALASGDLERDARCYCRPQLVSG
jgi:hypothetical protein